MNKSVLVASIAAFLLTACATTPMPSATPVPPPVVAVVKDKPQFPARPLTLLYTTFQDHAVLQRDKALPVWGRTKPGATVTVSLAGQTATATADDKGLWHAALEPMKAGGPYTLRATSSGGESQTVSDIMLGDVYLCSGQSNMELPLRLATNYDSEMRGAANTQIRLFHVHRHSSVVAKTVFGADASWSVTSPETVKEFSATCYYFGREVQPHAGVAVGLIEDAWGGSAIQAWISNKKMAALGGYDEALAIVKAYAASPAQGDLQYRAMVQKWFQANDPAMKAPTPWDAPSLDDTGWDELVATGGWRPWPKLANYNGIVWLRKTVNLTAADAGGAATLTLGQLSDFDLAFVNGTPVGAGEGYDVVRNYTVPAGVLHEGKNVIAVGIWMGGAFLDPASKMSLKLANGSVTPLSGPWKWKTSAPSAQLARLDHQPWLNQFGLSTLYNGMIVPLGDTQIRGIVWYQGETDAGQPKEYSRLLKALIEDWRSKFGSDTPFFVVQLPSYGPTTATPKHSDWAELRESQREVVAATPNTGLAVAIDLGSPDNIHPQAKQEVGRRLGLLARQIIYAQEVSQSPAPVAALRHGKSVVVSFAPMGKGLEAREWDRAVGFSLCDAPDACHFVDGIITKDGVKLDAAKHPKAKLVRYCWADSPLCNLVSTDGMPAVPFELPITTEKKAIKP